MDPSKRAQIRLNLGSRLSANARSADRATAPNVTNNTAYFPFSFLFSKRMTPIIRASVFLFAAGSGPIFLYQYQDV